MRDIDFHAHHILNVDDYAPARYSRSKALAAAGFKVTEAANGADALELAIDTKPHLIILDIHLPDISGLEVCRKLKEDSSTARIPILHISATAIEPSQVIGGLEGGADSYLTEPVDQGVLVATVRALLRAREAEEALAILNVQESERRRIALELHDDLAQRLSLLAMQLDLLRRSAPDSVEEFAGRLEPLARQVEALSDDIRRLSHQLHPSIVEDLGLESALRQLVTEFERIHKMPVQLTLHLTSPVPADTATAFYRIAQEALRNAAKHASGAPVRVTLSEVDGEVRLSISDNGPGFDITTVRKHGGLGLISMRERARLAGGRFSVQTRPGDGTEIVVALTGAAAQT